jgi:NADPH:quinone reductase-like Zn-dependent oxidoreductase
MARIVLEHDSRVLRDNPLGDPHIRRLAVWLPPGYDEGAGRGRGRRYPVLYDLVGFTGSGPAHLNWRPFDENVAERVKAITGGKMCDVVYDGVGKDTFVGSLDSLRPLGMMVSFGNASGPVDAFNVGVLAQKGSLFLTRPTLFTYASTPEKLAAMSKDLMDAMASGAVKIAVNARYPLADAAQAHRDLEARKTTGASVLIP